MGVMNNVGALFQQANFLITLYLISQIGIILYDEAEEFLSFCISEHELNIQTEDAQILKFNNP